MRRATQLLWVFLWLHLRLPPPAVPPENTPLNPAGDDMDDDLLEEASPPATKRKGEFGVIQVPTNRQEFQQWTAGLDRESVREGLLHFQALHEQHEREEHARQAEAMERASASGTVADDETPSGYGWTVVFRKNTKV